MLVIAPSEMTPPGPVSSASSNPLRSARRRFRPRTDEFGWPDPRGQASLRLVRSALCCWGTTGELAGGDDCGQGIGLDGSG
jgi:hypothetical protein